MNSLQAEIARRKARGNMPLTLRQLRDQLRALGYRLDRSMDCSCTARYMNGEDAGLTYPCTTTGVKHINSGLSFANIAHGMENSKTLECLQAFRFSGPYVILKNSILEI